MHPPFPQKSRGRTTYALLIMKALPRKEGRGTLDNVGAGNDSSCCKTSHTNVSAGKDNGISVQVNKTKHDYNGR